MAESIAPLIAQYVSGPAAGRRLSFERSPVVIGRDPSCDIVLPQDFASRQHAELRWENGAWVLENKSPNGAVVNGRKITRRPIILRGQDTLTIAGQTVLRLMSQAVADQTLEGVGDAGAEVASLSPPQPRFTGRTKLMIGIGVWWLLMMVAVVFFMTIKPDRQNGAGGMPQPLSANDIRQILSGDIKMVTPNPRVAQERLTEATGLFNRLDSLRPGALAECYINYREAEAYLGAPLEGADKLRLLEVEERLMTLLTTRYAEAMNMLNAKQWREAETALRKLQEHYPHPRSRLSQNMEALRAYANGKLPQR